MSRARDIADLAGSADAGGLTGRNLIINGAMQVAQRGTSATTSNYGTVDRWLSSYQGGTVTQSQESLTSSDTPYALGFRKFFRQTNTATASGTSDLRQLVQIIEAQNIANSGWNYTSASSYVTLSLWVRSSVAGKYGFYLLTYDTPNYQFAFTETLAANTWTKVTKTIPGNSNLVFNNDNGQGLAVVPVAWFGTDYTDSTATMDSWVAQDLTAYLPDDLADWAGTSGATFDVTGIQVEVGSTATPFEHRSYGDELRRCQRYYYQTTDYIRYMSQGPVGSQAWEWIDLPVTMRAQPTGLVYGNQNEADVGKAQQDGGDKETVNLYQSPFVLGLLCPSSTSGQNLQFWKIKVDAEL